jgi:hypothetical protein
MSHSPFMSSITLTTGGTTYNLFTLVSAIDSTLPQKCQDLLIQADTSGSAVTFIGNSNVSSTVYGVALTAGASPWSWSPSDKTSNLINLADINMVSATSSVVLHVTILTR